MQKDKFITLPSIHQTTYIGLRQSDEFEFVCWMSNFGVFVIFIKKMLALKMSLK